MKMFFRKWFLMVCVVNSPLLILYIMTLPGPESFSWPVAMLFMLGSGYGGWIAADLSAP